MIHETSSPDTKARPGSSHGEAASRGLEDEEGRGKIFSGNPRKPLKRLILDERIQGNPSFSNPLFGGFRAIKGGLPRKTKSSALPANGRLASTTAVALLKRGRKGHGGRARVQ